MSKPVLAIDYETYYDGEISVKTYGAGQYAAHPQCDVYMLSACDGTNTWVGHPRDFDWSVVDQYSGLVSYNAFFEDAMSNIALPRMGIPFPTGKLPWCDASDLGAYLFGTTNLNATIKKVYGVSLDKATRNSMKGKSWAECPDKDRMTEYARRDAYWAHKLWVDHAHLWPAKEQKISLHTRESSRRGVKVNVPLLRTYLAAAKQALFDVERQLPWVDELGEKPTGTKAIANQCRIAGIPCPPVKDKDEAGYIMWETTYAPRNPWILKVGQWRSVNKILGTLETMALRLRPDDTIESPTRYFGACSTGRWSGDGGLNFHNFRKEPIECAGVLIDIRSLLIPRDGMKMFVADLSQIEPRCLNWMVGNEVMLSLMRQGMSPYEAFARANLGWKGGKLKDEDPAQYAMNKAMVLALGYQAGAERFIEMAAQYTDGKLQLTLEQSQEAVDKFRSSSPLLTDKESGMWYVLDREFKKSANTDKNFEFELPSGRVMKYHGIRRGVRTRTEDVEFKRIVNGEAIIERRKVPKKQFVYVVEVDGRTKSVYGGLITENVTQAMARDVFAECYLALNDASLHVPFTVHDEAVIEAPMDTTVKDIEELMAVKPDWAPGLPVASEVQEVKHYLK
jgi:hypothetical protein